MGACRQGLAPRAGGAVARICARCRQPVDRDAREHDCPADDFEPEGSDEGEAA